MKNNQKYYAFFDNETSVVAKWIVITEQTKEGLQLKNKKYFFKEVPEPSFKIGQEVYIPTKWWCKRSSIVDIVPIFKPSGFNKYFYYIYNHDEMVKEYEIYQSAFGAVKEAFASSFNSVVLKITQLFKQR